MYEDPIVSEIRKYRSEHTIEYGYNLDRICEALRKRQKESRRKIVIHSPRLLLSRARANTMLQ